MTKKGARGVKTVSIAYTRTDEAPRLASASLLPVFRFFLAGVSLDEKDISLAGRVLALFYGPSAATSTAAAASTAASASGALLQQVAAAKVQSSSPSSLSAVPRVADALHELDDWVQQPEAVLVKLPNISASVLQLKACIRELQRAGYTDLPDYEAAADKYASVLGSAVNPVLRQGNSDRRAARAVKLYAQKHPHRMGAWSKDSKTQVASMSGGDFYANEKASQIEAENQLRIVFIPAQNNVVPQGASSAHSPSAAQSQTARGRAQSPSQSLAGRSGTSVDASTNASPCTNAQAQVLKASIPVHKGDVVDASFMSLKSLQQYLDFETQQAQQQNLLLSLHLKATMMKVSDPIIFGEVLKAYFKSLFDDYKDELKALNFNPRHGLKDLTDKLQNIINTHNSQANNEQATRSQPNMPPSQNNSNVQKGVKSKAPLSFQNAKQLLQAIDKCYAEGPRLAMTDSDKGLTHLHVPSDVIIDASMPALIRTGGQLWGPDGKTYDTKALIPDRSYASVYQTTIEFCKTHGAFDVATMGHVSNVGLMAQKAQEYGSHDKTFQLPSAGLVQVQNSTGQVVLEHKVEAGDIWRMCVTRGVAIDNWLQLACQQATAEKQVVFWLDDKRAHDRLLIQRAQAHLKQHQYVCVMSPAEATQHTLERTRQGLDTVSATGNVLRDYLTDLFPILELGTSSKMLSIVPLLQGGRLFETGAGGSAPRHVDQLLGENHLRWDSLGEFLAMAEAILFIGQRDNNAQLITLAEALNWANEQYLNTNKAPQRGVKSLDTRGSHFYLAFYWAQALAQQSKDVELQARFQPVFEALRSNEASILQELTEAQGQPVDVGGYYHPDPVKLAQVMRPSATLNRIIKST